MFVLGYFFIVAGKLKTTLFDKVRDRIIVQKTNVYCEKNFKAYKLSDITNIRAV